MLRRDREDTQIQIKLTEIRTIMFEIKIHRIHSRLDIAERKISEYEGTIETIQKETLLKNTGTK